jgi:hypothetical protein
MRIIEDLCPPATLYLLFIAIQSGLDVARSNFVTAGIKLLTGAAGAILLDILCDIDLGVVSWFIIATPFIITTLATSIAMGIGIDRMILTSVTEKFQDGAVIGDLPAAADPDK